MTNAEETVHKSASTRTNETRNKGRNVGGEKRRRKKTRQAVGCLRLFSQNTKLTGNEERQLDHFYCLKFKNTGKKKEMNYKQQQPQQQQQFRKRILPGTIEDVRIGGGEREKVPYRTW
jgi:hypothetical protein